MDVVSYATDCLIGYLTAYNRSNPDVLDLSLGFIDGVIAAYDDIIQHEGYKTDVVVMNGKYSLLKVGDVVFPIGD